MRVLLVEDETAVMTVLRFILRRRGYSVWEAVTADQALEACRAPNGPFDLLIADVNLPLMSGVDVALQLRAWMPKLKVILTSGIPLGFFNDQHAVLFGELPSDSARFLPKPFTPADVLRAVDSLISPLPGLSQVATTS
jgi:two-component system cell cycle sensor histidine kinase/response regulator CckA